MFLGEIKNHHIARLILLTLAVIICLGGFYRYLGYKTLPKTENQSDLQAILNESSRSIPPHTAFVSIHNKTYFVELATTNEEREKGLSNRKSLPENGGMLFVFDTPDQYKFWMKETLIPLDMIWISADKKIVYIEKNAQPGTYPAAYGPEENALYVIELAGGESGKNLFAIGDSVSFSSSELR